MSQDAPLADKKGTVIAIVLLNFLVLGIAGLVLFG